MPQFTQGVLPGGLPVGLIVVIVALLWLFQGIVEAHGHLQIIVPVGRQPPQEEDERQSEEADAPAEDIARGGCILIVRGVELHATKVTIPTEAAFARPMRVRSVMLLVVACFCSALLGVWVGTTVVQGGGSAGAGQSPTREELRLRSFASSSPTSFTTAAETVTPAVVSVTSYHRRALTAALDGDRLTTGSAVIISPDGYVATNNHVVEGARRIRVTLEDRREYDARVIGVDESTDLALLKIEASELPTLMFGNSDSLRVGEWVLAVGNPFSLNSTVTSGIVSAKGRSIDVLEPDDRIESFIQTDAAVNPGNSGGALVNTAGELIGINTAIITNSGRHEGYAFAIPGNLARRVLNDLRDYGEVKRAVLGVWIQGLNDAQAKRLGLPDAHGALVTDLTPGGPAARSGLEIGDVLTAINQVDINSSPELQEQLSRYRPGQRVRLTYLRNRRTRQLTVLLRDKTNRPVHLASEQSDDLLHRLGFEVRGLTPTERERFPDAGVRVISIFRDSPIEATNMEAGFFITAVDDRPTPGLREFLRALAEPAGIRFTGFYEQYPGRYDYALE